MQSSSSTGLGEGQGTDKERGPGLPSGPQEEYCGVISEEEALNHPTPHADAQDEEFFVEEEEEEDPWGHVPGARSDGEDIEPFGNHPWHRQFLQGWISGKKGGGRKRSSPSMDGIPSEKARSSR